MDVAAVEEVMQRLYLGEGGLRDEDRKKSKELAALVDELRRARRGLMVDAAAGHAYVGLVSAELIGVERLVVLERDAARAERARLAAARLSRPLALDVRVGDVAEPALWPAEPDVVVALHACGAASDATLDGATRAGARWIYLVPCCYAGAVPFSPVAEAHAARLGLTHHREVRRRLVSSLIDSERTLRLEAAGYDVTVVAFVAPTVTPHNLLWRARRANEPRRMADAAAKLERLRSGLALASS